MGMLSACPCLNRDPLEKSIRSKEDTLMLIYFTITEIKEAFFFKNSGETISYRNIMRGIEKLTKKNSNVNSLYKDENSETKKNFNLLLQGIIEGEPKEKLEANFFKFKPLMMMLIMFSMSIQDRMQGILKLEGKEMLDQDDVAEVLIVLFTTISDCSLQWILPELDEGKKEQEKKKYKLYQEQIEVIVDEVVEKVFQEDQEKTPIDLGYMFFQLILSMQFDATSASGIRKIMKDRTKIEDIWAIEVESDDEDEDKDEKEDEEYEAKRREMLAKKTQGEPQQNEQNDQENKMQEQQEIEKPRLDEEQKLEDNINLPGKEIQQTTEEEQQLIEQ